MFCILTVPKYMCLCAYDKNRRAELENAIDKIYFNDFDDLCAGELDDDSDEESDDENSDENSGGGIGPDLSVPGSVSGSVSGSADDAGSENVNNATNEEITDLLLHFYIAKNESASNAESGSSAQLTAQVTSLDGSSNGPGSKNVDNTTKEEITDYMMAMVTQPQVELGAYTVS